MNKIKHGLIYTSVFLVWVGGFYLAAKGGEFIGEGVGKACLKATERLCDKL